jgi:hypothetical protein
MIRTWIASYWIQGAVLLVLLSSPSFSWAADVSASAMSNSIGVGESTEIEVRLDLGAGELASIFEGRFDLVGSGSVIEDVVPLDLTAGGPTWGASAGGIVGTQAQVSMTSSNAGGSRLVATLTIVGMAAGTFQVELGSGSFAQRDLDVSPFFEDVALTTPTGSVLVTVTVTGGPQPVPALGRVGLLILVGSLLVSPAFVRRLKRPRA